MNNNYIYVVLVVVVIVLALMYYSRKKRVKNELIDLVQKNKFNEFDDLINSFLVRILFRNFEIDYLKLSKAFISNNKKEIDDQLAYFDNVRLGYKQKQDIYMKGFNYYVSIGDKKGAKKYLDLVETLNNEQMSIETSRIYDIYIEKGYKYLDEMIAETEKQDDLYKGVNEFLISLMYENKGERKKAEEYHRLSEKHMALLDRKIARNMKEKQEQQEKKAKKN